MTGSITSSAERQLVIPTTFAASKAEKAACIAGTMTLVIGEEQL